MISFISTDISHEGKCTMTKVSRVLTVAACSHDGCILGFYTVRWAWFLLMFQRIVLPPFFFIVAPCIPISIQFTHQQMHYLLNLERFKIYIKIHTKYRSYMFRPTTIIRELVLSLA
jgi:hypothetical protein